MGTNWVPPLNWREAGQIEGCYYDYASMELELSDKKEDKPKNIYDDNKKNLDKSKACSDEKQDGEIVVVEMNDEEEQNCTTEDGIIILEDKKQTTSNHAPNENNDGGSTQQTSNIITIVSGESIKTENNINNPSSVETLESNDVFTQSEDT